MAAVSGRGGMSAPSRVDLEWEVGEISGAGTGARVWAGAEAGAGEGEGAEQGAGAGAVVWAGALEQGQTWVWMTEERSW